MRRCSSKERQEMPDLNLLYLFMYLGLQTEENSILLSFVFETRLRSPECGILTYTIDRYILVYAVYTRIWYITSSKPEHIVQRFTLYVKPSFGGST